jgi:soluble lytic murein transglycosylase-like protein
MAAIVLATLFYSQLYAISNSVVFETIERESMYVVRATSGHGDYGLMQVRVSRNQLRRFLGREYLLYDTWTNIKYGCYMLAHWKRYHETHCGGKHNWKLHYKYGGKIKWKWK